MKKFLVRVLIFIAITLVADRVVYHAMKFFYERSTTTDEFKLNTVIDHVNDPVLFMGGSRCHHHYVPAIFADSFRTGVYNAGLWGLRNIYFHYGLLSNILERYTPKTIFLEIHPIDYLQTPFSGVEKAGNLAPFINRSEGCDEVLKEAGLYYKCEVSALYRYNSEFANIVTGNLSRRTNVGDKGYKSLTGQLDTGFVIKPEEFPFPVDEGKLRCFQAFIDKCKEKNIRLVLLYSPMYAVEKTNVFNVIDSMARKNNIPFLNHYSMDGITGHPEYYYDFGHLNDAGARKFSSMIASELKQYVKND